MKKPLSPEHWTSCLVECDGFKHVDDSNKTVMLPMP